MNPLPYRHRESSFRRYEAILAKAVASYPDQVEIDPKWLNLSPATVAARLRDARFSLYTYRWTTKIDMARFDEIYTNLVIGEREGHIYIGGREALKAANVETNLCLPTTTTACEVSTAGDRLTLIGQLAAARVLTCPLRVYLTDDDVNMLQANYDVVVEPISDSFGMYHVL
jgi:hypothetical protein